MLRLGVMIDVVWPETKQAGLIDSMLRNYYIPPVIFGQCILHEICLKVTLTSTACKIDPETHQEIRVCIDGKQRLTSIRK